jgi:hypothetical protein
MIEEERMVGVDMHDKQGEMVVNFREVCLGRPIA